MDWRDNPVRLHSPCRNPICGRILAELPADDLLLFVVRRQTLAHVDIRQDWAFERFHSHDFLVRRPDHDLESHGQPGFPGGVLDRLWLLLRITDPGWHRVHLATQLRCAPYRSETGNDHVLLRYWHHRLRSHYGIPLPGLQGLACHGVVYWSHNCVWWLLARHCQNLGEAYALDCLLKFRRGGTSSQRWRGHLGNQQAEKASSMDLNCHALRVYSWSSA